MNVLLDTHALLWYFSGSPRLSQTARVFIEDRRNILFVSPATLWKISIKDTLGKLTLPAPFGVLFPARLEADDIHILPILVPHLQRHRTLPTHHHDPFDRLLIAQALEEDMPLISCDSEFAAYGVKLVW